MQLTESIQMNQQSSKSGENWWRRTSLKNLSEGLSENRARGSDGERPIQRVTSI